MTTPRRAKLVLLVLAVALVGLGVWAWEPVYWWVVTESHFQESVQGQTRGWERRVRWGKALGMLNGKSADFHLPSGFKA